MGKMKRAVAAKAMKGLTLITSYLVKKRPRGRPRKPQQQPQATKPKCKETSHGPPPLQTLASTAGGKKRGMKRTYTDWEQPSNAAKLELACREWELGTDESFRQFAKRRGIPRATLERALLCPERKRRGQKPHLDDSQRRLLLDTIKLRARANDPMKRREIIALYQQLAGGERVLPWANAVQGFDRFHRHYREEDLTGLVKAQATTRKRSAQTRARQFRYVARAAHAAARREEGGEREERGGGQRQSRSGGTGGL